MPNQPCKRIVSGADLEAARKSLSAQLNFNWRDMDWRTKDKHILKVKDMSDQHVANAAYLFNQVKGGGTITSAIALAEAGWRGIVELSSYQILKIVVLIKEGKYRREELLRKVQNHGMITSDALHSALWDQEL